MPRRAWMRASPVLWLAPLLLFLALAHALSSVTSSTYVAAATATGTSTVFLLAPVCAACAAADARRLRRNDPMLASAVRHPLRVAGDAMSVTAATGVALLATATGVVVAGLPYLPALGVVSAIVVGFTALGYAVGSRLRAVFAVPGMLVAGYGAMVMPMTLEPVWLRHLNGAWFTCCDLSAQLSPRAMGAAGAVAAALIVTATALLLPGPGVRSATLMSPAVGLVAVAAVVVSPLGPDPVEPRDAQLNCAGQHPAVCVWPEHRNALSASAAAAADAAAAWRALGVSVPATFTESTRPAPTAVTVAVVPGDIDSTKAAFAAALLPAPPPCAARGPYPGGEAAPYLAAWLAAHAGVPGLKLPALWGDDVAEHVAELRALPVRRQQEWAARNIAALADCRVRAALDVPR